MKQIPQDIFDQITFIHTCPLCKTAYQKQAIRIVMGRGNTRWLHLTCGGCQSALMAVVVTGGSGVSSVGMMTDCSYEDAVRLKSEDVITTDDCLALHEFLIDLPLTLTLPPNGGGETTYDLSTDRATTQRKSNARARKR